MPLPPRAVLALCALSLPLTACVPLPDPPPATPGPATLAVLGTNGRTIGDHEAYWIPLDGPERLVPLGVPLREALAVRNVGGAPATIEAMWLAPLGDTLAPELTLLAPTRAAWVPLAAADRRLAPGEQLDFDVAVEARASGVRRARLTVRWAEGPDHHVELRARAEGTLRLHDPSWPTWPAPTWGVASRAGEVALEAAALHRDNLYVAGARAGGGRVVARVAPEGALQWVTAVEDLEAPGGGGAATLCAGSAGVAAIATGGPGEGGTTSLTALWFDHDGALRWGRAWAPTSGPARADRCVVTNDLLWILGAAGDEVFAAAVALDGEALGVWLGGDGPATIMDAVAGRGGGVVFGGARGDEGFVARLEEGAIGRWHELPGPALALAALAQPGDVALAWRLPGGALTLGVVDPDGALRWRRRGTDAAAVALAADGDALHVVAVDALGVVVRELGPEDGAPRTGARLGPLGADRVLDASAAAGRLRYVLAGLPALGGAETWYQAAPLAPEAGAAVIETAHGRLAARPAARWEDASPWLQAWDAAADLVVAPLSANGPRALVVTGPPRPDSG